MLNNKEELKLVVKTSDKHKANNIVALNMEGISLLSDYFVIMDVPSTRQVKAISNEIIDESHKNNMDVEQVEGLNEGNWVLIDLGDVIVHVFETETRNYYNLEKLWSDAENVDISSLLNKE